jgi:hypothetical protein
MNLSFVAILVLAVTILLAVAGVGILRWRHPGGKAVAIIATLLLLALAAFVVGVLYLAHSAEHGAPM